MNGDSNKWDLTTLATLLINGDRPKQLNKREKQRLHQEDGLVKQLKNIRNELAHHASKSIANEEFNQRWTDLRSILVTLGDPQTELDELKDDSMFESSTQSVNEDSVKEALRLNSLGTQAHKVGKFSEAISLFIQATTLPNVSDHDRAIFVLQCVIHSTSTVRTRIEFVKYARKDIYVLEKYMPLWMNMKKGLILLNEH